MKWYKKCIQKISTWSLVKRLILFFSLFAMLVWGIAMVTSWRFDGQHIRFFYDSHMQLFAKSLAELNLDKMHGEVDRIEEILPQKRKKRLDAVNDGFSFAVFSHDGYRILSDDDDGKDFPFLTQRGFSTIEVDDDKWRMYVYPTRDRRYFILVGQEKEFQQDIVFKVLLRHVWPWLALLPVFIIGLAWILHKELKPLRILTQGLKNREADDTSPILMPTVTVETRPLLQALNALFERIANLLQKERAFVSNAAHELRTPLAGLRVQAEVMEMCMDDADARQNSLQKILEGTQRCTHLVEQLLLLSSIEAKTAQAKDAAIMGAIPWEILVQDAMDTVASAASYKQIQVQCTLHALPLCKEGYGELWGIALRNLLDNAVRYTPTGGMVHVVLQEKSLYVENTAPHIEPENLEHLGQRFYRPPGQKERGSGLGLAIVGHIAGLHGAKVRVENVLMHGAEPEHGVRVSLIF